MFKKSVLIVVVLAIALSVSSCSQDDTELYSDVMEYLEELEDYGWIIERNGREVCFSHTVLTIEGCIEITPNDADELRELYGGSDDFRRVVNWIIERMEESIQ